MSLPLVVFLILLPNGSSGLQSKKYKSRKSMFLHLR